MSVMADVSRAIRLALAPHGENLAALPDRVLEEAHTMVAAFAADFGAEIARRRSASMTFTDTEDE